MIQLSDVRSDKNEWRISLIKLIGKEIADIEGCLTEKFGGVSFKISEVILSDGSSLDVEGEHDFPYLCAYSPDAQPNFNDETFKRLHDEGNNA